MQEVFNYYYYSGLPMEGLENPTNIKAFTQKVGLDGVELYLAKDIANPEQWQDVVVGLHLPFWGGLVPLYENDREELQKQFPTEEALRANYGATSWSEFVENFRCLLKLANYYKPKYVVWHVQESSFEEDFTFKFKYSNMDSLRVNIELYKAVADVLNPDIDVLFENLWWPGLTLRNPEEVAYFFEQLKDYNVGIMLDTGHLLNTSLDVHNQQEAFDFLVKTVLALGSYRHYIKGLHLSLSLSAEYRASCPKEYKGSKSMEQFYAHLAKIDEHRPFTEPGISRLLELVQPKYINHELVYYSRDDLQEKLKMQKDCMSLNVTYM